MFRLTQNSWFRRIALGTVAAIGLGAAALPAAPAQARVFVDIGVPGYVAPYYGYGYYPYYNPYYYAPVGVYWGGGWGGHGGWHGGGHWHR
jgi:hypothetical protein